MDKFLKSSFSMKPLVDVEPGISLEELQSFVQSAPRRSGRRMKVTAIFAFLLLLPSVWLLTYIHSQAPQKISRTIVSESSPNAISASLQHIGEEAFFAYDASAMEETQGIRAGLQVP